MAITNFDSLASRIAEISVLTHQGTIIGSEGNLIHVKGLNRFAAVGDMVSLPSAQGAQIGEVLGLSQDTVTVFPAEGLAGCAQNAPVRLLAQSGIFPDRSWLGRVIDPFGAPLDRRPIVKGRTEMSLRASPPAAASRNRLGNRLETNLAVFNTLLPLVRGQRLGLFAGSGVGKSSLLADLCRGVEADVTVLALVGERGRELREFTEDILGKRGLEKSVVVAATSDQSALVRRRAAGASMAVAEYFRDQGAQVLYLCDSLTRFAEAHREVVMSCGEVSAGGGYPASTNQAIMSLCERAGPGPQGAGDITAIFSVLVAGSNMEEPLADTVRGVLDGHIVLDRAIAEHGRFPAIDVLRSVSRSLPNAASKEENKVLEQARGSMASYRDVELMLQAGLYSKGSDERFDLAISQRPKLEAFLAQKGLSVDESFVRLVQALETPEKNVGSDSA